MQATTEEKSHPKHIESFRQQLIHLLQGAYSGELAAANAYRGHWQSVRQFQEKEEILQIEIEELQHRQCVGHMLVQLGAQPNPWREFYMDWLGKTIGLFCHFGGWFLPMYGAGRLERNNIDEYIHAARFAILCRQEDLVEKLIQMAELEWEHERYFREKINQHWLYSWFPHWSIPQPKASLREPFLPNPTIPGYFESIQLME